MSNNLFTRLYAIPSNADATTIATVIDAIHSDYGIPADEDDGVPPSQVAAAQTGSLELDADGVPHDERIHAKTKSKNADGRWKKLKGVSPELHAQITAQLKAASTAAPAPSAASTAPALPTPAAAPTAPALPTPAALSPYQELLRDVGPHVNSGALTAEWLNQVSQHFGIEGGWPNAAAASAESIKAVRDYIVSVGIAL